MKGEKTMTVIVETTSLAEEIVFRDIIRIEDKEEWIVLNDKMVDVYQCQNKALKT